MLFSKSFINFYSFFLFLSQIKTLNQRFFYLYCSASYNTSFLNKNNNTGNNNKVKDIV